MSCIYLRLLGEGVLMRDDCSNLNRRRYAQNDDTLYVAPEDERTDYVSNRTPR